MKAVVSHERLLEVLDYEPETGLFRRRIPMQCRVKVGEVAGGRKGAKGHIQIRLDGRLYLAHRLAWFYVHGRWPAQCIDHIDGDPANNRLSNLRDVAQRINLQNRRTPSSANKTSRLLGVSFCRRTGRWRSCIRVEGRQKSLGYFDSENEAHARYVEAKRQLHPGCTI